MNLFRKLEVHNLAQDCGIQPISLHNPAFPDLPNCDKSAPKHRLHKSSEIKKYCLNNFKLKNLINYVLKHGNYIFRIMFAIQELAECVLVHFTLNSMPKCNYFLL